MPTAKTILKEQAVADKQCWHIGNFAPISVEQANFFTEKLLYWNEHQNKREMPWKGISDPYKIWLSEIILQQTRVAQGLPYYQKFATAFPDIHALANASQDEVMTLWQGLGYYSRARNLHATAQYISRELGGVFPNTYVQIRQLTGVGDYTAAAIASFAYNLPHAVLDGNVFRVLARYFGIEQATDETATRKHFATLAQQLLPPTKAGKYNQAIMDFGAEVCTPALPDCANCVLQTQCTAFAAQKVNELPIKSKKIKIKHRYFVFLYLHNEAQFFIEKRTEADIWQNLYQLPLIEVKNAKMFENINPLLQQNWGVETTNLQLSKVFVQQLTHQKIHAVFAEAFMKKELNTLTIPATWLLIFKKNYINFAFPKLINLFLSNIALTST
ncbi:MAG: A/G-specific adenine glycosylase [Chitinophagales bacterium]